MEEKEISIELIYGLSELTNDSFPTHTAKQSSLYLIEFILKYKDKNIDWKEVEKHLDNMNV